MYVDTPLNYGAQAFSVKKVKMTCLLNYLNTPHAPQPSPPNVLIF